MDFPYILVQGQGEYDPVRVYITYEAEYATLDEAALADAVKQHLIDHEPYVTDATAERYDRTVTVTQM